jgi:hypothetical protein
MASAASGKDEASESSSSLLFAPGHVDFSKLQTRTGKPLHDGGETDQYILNTAPSWKVLSKFPSTRLMDEEGRIYWLAISIKGLDSEFLKEIKQSATFDPATDAVFYVRPAPGTPAMEFTLPDVSCTERRVFYTNGTPPRKWTAIVKDSGADQLSASTSSTRRKSSYVVLSHLRPAAAAPRR